MTTVQRKGKAGTGIKLMMCALLAASFTSAIAPREAAAAQVPAMKAIGAAGDISFAIAADGELWNWGDFYENPDRLVGQPDLDVVQHLWSIDDVWGGQPFGLSSISAGNNHALFLKGSQVWGLGATDFGQLAYLHPLHPKADRFTVYPEDLGISNARSVAAGDGHSVALRSNRTVWEWGFNAFDFLGERTPDEWKKPVQVPGFPDDTAMIAVAAGARHTLAINANNELFAWGYNGDGQLGIGSAELFAKMPTKVKGNLKFKAVDAGPDYTIALNVDGTVYASGSNACGILGTNAKYSTVLVQVNGLTDIVAIAAGDHHSLALGKDGKVRVWGCETKDSQTVTKLPRTIDYPNNVKSIAAGAWHSVILTDDGVMWAWGDNSKYQVGPFGASTIPNPVQIVHDSFKPEFISVTPGDKQVKLVWKTAGNDVTGHEICWRSTSGGGTTCQKIEGKSSYDVYTYTVTGLSYSPRYEYKFYVRAKDKSGKKSETSDYVTANPTLNLVPVKTIKILN
ncbi:RCC1 domain-containing protein [Cohnella panacarvi]|uniref:RCC1 domain-containing protein n=1 Tax=Cohnella panacarvi TaxID=400776 RepID=UPI00047A8F65|nr:fibronectin type III domain-containing protein [Cohnella panacarvi]